MFRPTKRYALISKYALISNMCLIMPKYGIPRQLQTGVFVSGMSAWAASRAITTAGVHGIVPLTTPLLDIPHIDLAYWMGKFILEVHAQEGWQ